MLFPDDAWGWLPALLVLVPCLFVVYCWWWEGRKGHPDEEDRPDE